MISDKRTLNGLGVYEAEIINAQDYYAFGSIMPGRAWSLGDSYRYGFNGKENDNEVKGTGNSLDFGARIYDPRLGRWLSLDPLMKKYPYLSPYAAMGNDPINIIDPDGRELVEIIIKTKSPYIKGQLTLVVDKEIASKVKELIKYAIDNKIYVHLNSDFRSTGEQGSDKIQKKGTTPAKPGTSRHEGGFALDFNLYANNDPKKLSRKNKDIDSKNPFIVKAKELGFRWGADFGDPIHIDAWTPAKKSLYGYESFSDAVVENQADNSNKTQDTEYFTYPQIEFNFDAILNTKSAFDEVVIKEKSTTPSKDTKKKK